jgi:hypothetical protein
MSVPSNVNIPSDDLLQPLATPAGQGVMFRAANARRRLIVNGLRVLLFVVIVGGWELLARAGIIDRHLEPDHDVGA